MYQLQDSVLAIKGIGKNLQEGLAEHQIEQILDFLLFLPLRYEDRSVIKTIAEIKNLGNEATQIVSSQANQKVKTNFVTTRAKVTKWSEYRKGRLLISRATIADSTDQINCLWFNNKFLKNKIVIGQEFTFSGQLKEGSLMQATVEKVATESTGIHTGRLVPIYSKLSDLKQGNLRRLLAEAISKLHQSGELEQVFRDLHFPESIDRIVTARERLAMEEILYLMQKSARYKKAHQQEKTQFSLSQDASINSANLEKIHLPFTLTSAQAQAVQDILTDISQKSPMNRLLVGDVGSGKTIVAAIPASILVQNGQHVCLLAPTKILAKQHFDNLSRIFPSLDFRLVSGGDESAKKEPQKSQKNKQKQGIFYIGTHALLKQLKQIEPSLVIYDEQQRFGVKHRQLDEYLSKNSAKHPHLLSMTATPIPRSLMLSIFSHLELSYLDQMPNARKMATTWLVPEEKEGKALEWLVQELLKEEKMPNEQKATNKRVKQALIICPFINPSIHQATENVAAVEETLKMIKKNLAEIYQKLEINPQKQFKIDILHSKLSKDKQTQIIDQVYQQKIQILVSTPMVEVGVDLPNADIIIINSAERFGLSSLHQLRGRVGRQGQESFCLLFTSSQGQNPSNPDAQARLKKFCHEKDGLKLAQIDLENRGAGDLLGYQQSGLHNLHFASWTNLQIIEQAKIKFQENPSHQSLLQTYLDKISPDATIETATN